MHPKVTEGWQVYPGALRRMTAGRTRAPTRLQVGGVAQLKSMYEQFLQGTLV